MSNDLLDSHDMARLLVYGAVDCSIGPTAQVQSQGIILESVFHIRHRLVSLFRIPENNAVQNPVKQLAYRSSSWRKSFSATSILWAVSEISSGGPSLIGSLETILFKSELNNLLLVGFILHTRLRVLAKHWTQFE